MAARALPRAMNAASLRPASGADPMPKVGETVGSGIHRPTTVGDRVGAAVGAREVGAREVGAREVGLRVGAALVGARVVGISVGSGPPMSSAWAWAVPELVAVPNDRITGAIQPSAPRRVCGSEATGAGLTG